MYLWILAGCSNESPIQLTPFDSFTKNQKCMYNNFIWFLSSFLTLGSCMSNYTVLCWGFFLQCIDPCDTKYFFHFSKRRIEIMFKAANISNQCCQYVVLHIIRNSVFGWTSLGILKIIQKYQISLIKFVWSKLALKNVPIVCLKVLFKLTSLDRDKNKSRILVTINMPSLNVSFNSRSLSFQPIFDAMNTRSACLILQLTFGCSNISQDWRNKLHEYLASEDESKDDEQSPQLIWNSSGKQSQQMLLSRFVIHSEHFLGFKSFRLSEQQMHAILPIYHQYI